MACIHVIDDVTASWRSSNACSQQPTSIRTAGGHAARLHHVSAALSTGVEAPPTQAELDAAAWVTAAARFGCQVTMCSNVAGGGWQVAFWDGRAQQQVVAVSDYLVVASGLYSTPRIPKVQVGGCEGVGASDAGRRKSQLLQAAPAFFNQSLCGTLASARGHSGCSKASCCSRAVDKEHVCCCPGTGCTTPGTTAGIHLPWDMLGRPPHITTTHPLLWPM